jgi:hypothetical protein
MALTPTTVLCRHLGIHRKHLLRWVQSGLCRPTAVNEAGHMSWSPEDYAKVRTVATAVKRYHAARAELNAMRVAAPR